MSLVRRFPESTPLRSLRLSKLKKPKVRVNKRALGLALLLILLAIPAFAFLKRTQDRRLSSAALATAREFARTNQNEQAIRHMRHYLGTNPDDKAALSLQAELLYNTVVRTPEQIPEATTLNERVLRDLLNSGNRAPD